jgi:hypothetical protein
MDRTGFDAGEATGSSRLGHAHAHGKRLPARTPTRTSAEVRDVHAQPRRADLPRPTTDNGGPPVFDLPGRDQTSPQISPDARDCEHVRPAGSSAPARPLGGVTPTTSTASNLSKGDGCFIAYAAHELRGEITVQLTLAEGALADPNADTAALRRMGEGIVAACERQERLLEALLTLARSEYGHLRREPLDLGTLTRQAMLAHEPQLADLNLDLHVTLDTAPAAGDPRLIERLIANLIDNAVHHNSPGGHVEITTGTHDHQAFVSVSNTGPTVPPEETQRLLRPFQRLDGARTSHDEGHGLGLSIVQAIANAHGANLNARPRREGGLTIEVSFPTTSGASSTVTSPLPGPGATARQPVSGADAPARS